MKRTMPPSEYHLKIIPQNRTELATMIYTMGVYESGLDGFNQDFYRDLAKASLDASSVFFEELENRIEFENQQPKE